LISSGNSPDIANRWRAAVCLGLISSTFSTVVSQLSAARIGRDASVDWMSVAAIPARDWALTAEPSIGAIAVGITFHQWADFSWGGLFRSFWEMDRHSPSGLARRRRRAMGHPSLGARMVYPSAVVSVLATDLHIAIVLLDRLPGPSIDGVHVSAVRLASSLAFCTERIRRQDLTSGLEPWRDLRYPAA
jgi:hypothetical protein